MKLSRDNLHEYQKYGVDFIINNPISALMLECGLGKTIQISVQDLHVFSLHSQAFFLSHSHAFYLPYKFRSSFRSLYPTRVYICA